MQEILLYLVPWKMNKYIQKIKIQFSKNKQTIKKPTNITELVEEIKK